MADGDRRVRVLKQRSDRNADARNVVYIVCSMDRSIVPLSTRYCSAHSPEMSAVAASMAL